MSTEAAASAFTVINAGLEAISATMLILNRISQRQQERAAEGKALTKEDLAALMNEGDVKAAAERVTLSGLKITQAQSGGG